MIFLWSLINHITINKELKMDSWNRLSKENKIQLFDYKKKITNCIDYTLQENQNKKNYLRLIISSLLNSNKFDIVNEIYFDILFYKENINYYFKIEKIIQYVLKMKGDASDDYWIYYIYRELWYYYINDKNKVVEIDIQAYNELNSKFNEIMEDGYLKAVFFRDLIIFDLIEIKDFKKAEFYLNDAIIKGLYNINEGDEQYKFNSQLLYGAKIENLITRNMFDDALFEIKKLISINKELASNMYKMIGNEYFKNKDFKNALKYLEESKKLNPIIMGVDNKIIRSKDELNYI